jgi:hypothetical protein
MEATLNIKEAIRYFNTNRPEGVTELTSAALALMVFADKKSSDESKVVLFYQITNNRRRFVDLNWLVKISEITGYPPEKLICYTNKTVNYGKQNDNAPGTTGQDDRQAPSEVAGNGGATSLLG